MTPLILVAAMAGLPFLLALILRVSAVYLFLSLLIGDILVRYLSDDVTLAISTFQRNFHSDFAVQLGLLAAPIILTLFFLRRSVPKSKLLLHIVPLAVTSAAMVVLALPLLPGGVQHNIVTTPWGNVIKNSQDLILSIAGITVLLLAWLTGRHKEGHGKHHK
jgi:hypothetical protein